MDKIHGVGYCLRMDCRGAIDPPVIAIIEPEDCATPLVLASPHSGSVYPEGFRLQTPLPDALLRRSEDCQVDALFAPAAEAGVPLLRALFPRAFVDVNREPFELDQAMFSDPLPDFANCGSARVQAGLGTIARVVASGIEIYRDKLPFAEAAARIDGYYRPYHAALRRLLDRARDHYGAYLLIDCHSMPSSGVSTELTAPYQSVRGSDTADIVLGDCFQTACATAITDCAETFLRQRGYAVVRNHPYAGGHTTRTYGRPADGGHALQIELSRALYLDEARFALTERASAVARDMTALVETLDRLMRREYCTAR